MSKANYHNILEKNQDFTVIDLKKKKKKKKCC